MYLYQVIVIQENIIKEVIPFLNEEEAKRTALDKANQYITNKLFSSFEEIDYYVNSQEYYENEENANVDVTFVDLDAVK